jgi:hypothetical protein
MPRPAEHTGSVPCRATYDTRGHTYSPSSPECSVRVSRRRINAARERSSNGYAARPMDGAIERKTEIIRRRGHAMASTTPSAAPPTVGRTRLSLRGVSFGPVSRTTRVRAGHGSPDARPERPIGAAIEPKRGRLRRRHQDLESSQPSPVPHDLTSPRGLARGRGRVPTTSDVVASFGDLEPVTLGAARTRSLLVRTSRRAVPGP